MKPTPVPATFITLVKNAFVKCLPVIMGVLLFAACGTHNEKPTAEDTDPIFKSDPRLKGVTEEIKQAPKDGALYFKRGGMLHKMQLDSLAIKDYKTAISLDTNNAAYYSAIGDLLFENKDLTGSVTWIQKAIIKNPTDRKAHLKIAKLFLYIKEYPRAFSEINIVLREDVHNPEAYFLKAMVYKDMKDTAKAMSNFHTAIESDPEYRDAMIQLGLLYSAKKDPIGLRYLQNAYKMDSTDVFPLFATGVYYQDKKDYVMAKQYYRQCIIRDWHYAEPYFNMGYLLVQDDSFAKAYRNYDIITKIQPRNPAGYFNRGLCSEMMDSIKKAIDDYKIALSMDPNYDKPKEALKRLKK